ncbi:hypothetical protein WL65_29600 [Burkholderia ubonensis]|nr:hypothetical protein WJ94_01780 [Burkholderia ubonensis]KVR51463.1 hypothetical protein WK19_23965 [Burkholderia ubonensis]KWD38403.1 hypothetical protein WL65_29600 [Burkholderia ubonensis]
MGLIADLGVGYLHIAEADWDDAPLMPVEFKQKLRAAYPGVLIYAGKYTAERAREAIAAGWADLIAFGRPFVASPDLPERLRVGAALAPHDRDTLFGGGARAATDPAAPRFPTAATRSIAVIDAGRCARDGLPPARAMAPSCEAWPSSGQPP